MMSTKCNLACSYCYLQDSVSVDQSLDFEFAKQGIRDYFADSPSRHIRFFACGEPTLEFELIKAIKDFAHELAGNDLSVEIQTNGVFSVKIANWLAHNANIVWISHDGIPEVHDSLRPTIGGGKTSEVIERNISLLLAQGCQVGLRATITPLNLFRQVEIIQYFNKLGVKAVFSDPVFPAVSEEARHSKDKGLGSEFMMTYAREFVKARIVAEELGIFYGSFLAVNFDERTEVFCRSCLPSPNLTPDGYVTSCDMAFSKDALPELVYGKYDRETGIIEYNNNRIAAIRLRKASNLVECQGCEVLYHCAGSCLGEGLNETGRILGVKQDYCDAIRYLAKHLPIDSGLYPYLHP